MPNDGELLRDGRSESPWFERGRAARAAVAQIWHTGPVASDPAPGHAHSPAAPLASRVAGSFKHRDDAKSAQLHEPGSCVSGAAWPRARSCPGLSTPGAEWRVVARYRTVRGAVPPVCLRGPFVYVYINCAMSSSPEETIARFGLGDEGLAAWRAALLPEDRFADWLTDRVARRPTGARARAVYGADDVHDFARRAVLGALDLQPDDRLLDIGCGGGLLLRDAASAGAVVTGLDHSEEMVMLARERAPGAPREVEIERRHAADPLRAVVEGARERLGVARPAQEQARAGRRGTGSRC